MIVFPENFVYNRDNQTSAVVQQCTKYVIVRCTGNAFHEVTYFSEILKNDGNGLIDAAGNLVVEYQYDS